MVAKNPKTDTLAKGEAPNEMLHIISQNSVKT